MARPLRHRLLSFAILSTLVSSAVANWTYPCPPIPREQTVLVNQTLPPAAAANFSFVFCVDPVQFAVLWLSALPTNATSSSTSVPPLSLTVSVLTSNSSVYRPGPFMKAKWVSDRFLFVLKPTVVLPVCGPGVCTLSATVTWDTPASTPSPYSCVLSGYRGNVVPFERPLQSTLSSARVLGVEIGKSDLTVRVHLSASAPLSVSVFEERDPFGASALTASVAADGSQILVFSGTSSQWAPGIFFFRLTPLTDSLSFTFLAESNYSESSSFSLYGIFASMAFLLVCLFGVALLFARRRLTPSIATAPPQGSEEGASQQQIERLPTAVFATGLFSAEDSRCAVCLGDYEPGQVLRKLQCAHHFHRDCIDCWLRTRRCCPLCQHELDCPVGPRYPRAPTIAALPTATPLTIRVDSLNATPPMAPAPSAPGVILSIRVTSSASHPVQIAIRVLPSASPPRRQAFPPSVTQRLAHLALRRVPSPSDGALPTLSSTPSARSLTTPTPIDEDATTSVLELPSL